MKRFLSFRHIAIDAELQMLMKLSREQENIKKYLLGDLNDEELQQNIERRLMIDDEFAEEVSICEEELIDDYLAERLSESARAGFENHFLALPEMRDRLRFALVFKAHLDEQKPDAQVKPEKKNFINRLRLSFPVPAFAALAVLLIGGIIFSVWYFSLRQSDSEQELAALEQVYGATRPFEARISGFNYAAFQQTRGNNENQADSVARDEMELLLRSTAKKNKNAASLYALGKFYLVEKNLEKAVGFFEEAEKLAPNDARLQSDLGAALFEMSRKAAESKDGAESLKLSNQSLKHLEKAIELNSQMLEPRFNRALCLEMFSPQEAKQAWREYLELDPNSKWTDEARRHLQSLESQKTQNLSADELEKAFLDAARRKNDAEAARLISQNRELITEKYLPQKLAMSFVEASDAEKPKYLQALIYAGELEKKAIGDLLAADIAAFYRQLSAENLELLRKAQLLMRNGYRLCLDEDFRSALTEFKLARELFLQSGNIWEAKLSEYPIIYCLIITKQIKASLTLAENEKFVSFCEQRNYKWLLSNTLYWLAAAQRVTGQRSKAKINYQECLKLAEEINDPIIYQKILISLSKQSSFVGQQKTALSYLQKVYEDLTEADTSARQKWMSYSDSVEILANARLYHLAKAVSLENIQLSRDLQNHLFLTYSKLDAGIAYRQIGDYTAAEKWLSEAKKDAAIVSEEEERKSLLAKTSLELGHVERKLGDNLQAARFYDEAYDYIKNDEVPYYIYEIQKSRLLASVSLNDDAEAEKQIAETLNLAEKYREQISEEQERNSFFDHEQNIYDIAVAHEFKRARYEQAYNYLEASNSRSLLDWLKKGATVKEERKNIEINFKDNAKPVQLDEIRAQMPERVQILQYAVLEDKVLAWVVTKNSFFVAPKEIESEKLREKVERYVRLLSSDDQAKQAETEALSRELYTLLISPVIGQLDPAREICLIPHKILFHLPFAALTKPDGKPFLAEFNFFYAPSANIFLLCTKNAELKNGAGDESLLSVGNPHFNRREFDDLQYLPAAEIEAHQVAELYRKKQLLPGAAATERAFRDSLADAEIIHFAGHYLVKHGEPLFSSLLLTQTGNDPEDGVLTNSELIRQKLPRAKLVVLSACQTGIEQYYNGEGLVGLSRTFLAAGAPLVVASQWKVDSDATAELMKKFHFYRSQEKLSTTAALRRAQLEMSESPDGRFGRPYFWAAFAAFGGYAEF